MIKLIGIINEIKNISPNFPEAKERALRFCQDNLGNKEESQKVENCNTFIELSKIVNAWFKPSYKYFAQVILYGKKLEELLGGMFRTKQPIHAKKIGEDDITILSEIKNSPIIPVRFVREYYTKIYNKVDPDELNKLFEEFGIKEFNSSEEDGSLTNFLTILSRKNQLNNFFNRLKNLPIINDNLDELLGGMFRTKQPVHANKIGEDDFTTVYEVHLEGTQIHLDSQKSYGEINKKNPKVFSIYIKNQNRRGKRFPDAKALAEEINEFLETQGIPFSLHDAHDAWVFEMGKNHVNITG